MNTPTKYLGDGVYFHFDGYHVVLTANSGGQTNNVFLEPEVIIAFQKALVELAAEVKKMKDLPQN